MKFFTRNISESDLELIRYWRNKDFVRNQMLTKDLISSENQNKWFLKMDKSINHIFIYSLDNIDVGCVNCKISDSKKGIFDIGVYCGNSEYFGNPVNLLSIIFIHDYAFNTLKLNLSITSIKKDNKSSIGINKKIGYEFYDHLNKEFDLYSLNNSKYISSKNQLKKIISYFAKL